MATGTNNSDILIGGNGVDIIDGKKGDDIILGLGGNDIITAGEGKDYVDGGSGSDIIDGGDGADILMGGAGSDVIEGGAGADIIDGGADNDLITGGAGADIIKGGAGTDVIDGGLGNDILEGGAGADVFQFLNNGHDVVTDFNASQNDTLFIDTIAGVSSLHDVVVTEDSLTHTVTITAPSNPNFSITLQNTSYSDVMAHLVVACLLRGTMVSTPSGEVPVETLSIGDLVNTVDGVAKPIKWVGKRAYGGAFARGNARVTPVKITAGALGRNTPARDLLVSPEHAVLVEGVLVPAQHLVNGETIVLAEGMDLIEYFHLEFETPQVVFTNGAATESYVDEGSRRMFANYQEFVELYGEQDAVAVGTRRFPLVQDGPELASIQSRLTVRTAAVA